MKKLVWMSGALFVLLTACNTDLEHISPFDPLSPAQKQAKGAVTGSVSLENETDHSQVSIKLLGTHANYETSTEPSGAFHFGFVIPGDYKLTAVSRYFKPAEVMVTVGLGGSVDVSPLSLGSLRTTVGGTAFGQKLVNQSLARQGGVLIELLRSGSVRGATAAPGTFRKAASESTTTTVRFTTLSDSEGAWSVDEVPTGVYTVTASQNELPSETIGDIRVEGTGGVAVDDILLLPLTGFFEIEGAAGSPLYTTSPTVTLRLSGLGATRDMKITNRTGNTCVYNDAAMPLEAIKIWNVGFGEGLKTVCVRFVGADRKETADLLGAITLDSTPPVLATVSFTNTNGYTTQPQGILQLAGVDATSGLGTAQWGASEASVTASTVPWQSALLIPFAPVTSGTKTVWLRAVDRAGNMSPTVSAEVIYDHDRPVLGALSLLGENGLPAAKTRSNRLSVGFEAADPDGHPIEMMISDRSDFFAAAWQPYRETFVWDVAAPAASGGAERTLYAKVRDFAGRTSDGFRSASIWVDTVAPQGGTATFARASTNSALNAQLLLGGSDWNDAEVAFDLTFAEVVSSATSPFDIDLRSADGLQNVYVRFRDDAGNTSAPVAASIILDTTPPVNPSFVINNTSPTNDLELDLALSAVDATQFRVEEGTVCTSTDWKPYAMTHDLPILAGDGLRSFSVQFRDGADNRTVCLTRQIMVDRTAPVVNALPAFTVGSVTRNNLVTLQFDVSDADQVRIAENLGFTGAAWEPYAASKLFQLSQGDNLKTVYVEFRDWAGNPAGPESATITLDAAAPTNVLFAAASQYVTTGTASLTLTAGGSPTHMMLAEDLGFAGVTEQAFNAAPSWTVSAGDGEKIIYAKVRDAAGNWSAATSVRLVSDTVAPSETLVSVNGGAILTNSAGVTLQLSALGADELQVSGDIVGGVTSWLSARSTLAVNLTPVDGLKTVSVRWRDKAGWITGAVTAATELDTDKPSPGGIAIGSTELVKNPVQTLSLTASGATQMMIANDAGFLGGAWEAVSASKSWALSAGDGLKTVYLKFRDAAGNESAPVQDTIELDTVPPTGAAFSIAEGAETSSVIINLTLSAVDAAVYHASNSADFSTGSWKTYGAAITHTVPAGDGLKVVYVKFRDAAGNETGVLTQVVTLDTGAPTGPQLLIDGGAAYTMTASVTLYLSAAGAIDMAFSNDGATFGLWQPFAPSTGYPLDGTDGAKTVWAKFRDGAGNVSGLVNDTIVLDRSGPTGGSVVIDGGAPYTRDAQVVLTIGVTGASEMQIAESDSFSGAAWEPVSNTRLFTLSGNDAPKTVYVRFRDAAGHISTHVSDGITLDQSPPVLQSPAVSLAGGAAYTNSNVLPLTLQYVDAVQAVVAEDISLSFPLATYLLPGGGIYATTVTLPAGEGTRTLYVKFIDAAGNSIVQSDAVVLDINGPTSVSVRIDADAAFNTSAAGAAVLSLSGTDNLSGIAQMRLSNTNTNGDLDGAAAVAYNAAPGWVLASPGSGFDANRTVYVQLIDTAGNPSAIVFDSIRYDTAPPAAGSVSIDGGADYVRTTTVNLALGVGGDPAEMIVGNDGAFTGRSFEPYATQRSWLLSSGGDGQLRTVYAQFRDQAGNLSGVYSDTITVDTVAPSAPALTLDGGAEYGVPNAAYTQDDDVEATATASGWTSLELSEDVSFLLPLATVPSSTPMPLQISFTPRADGSRTLYARFADNAGNTSPIVAASILQDGAGPQFPSLKLNDGEAWTGSSTLTAVLGASDTLSGLDTVTFASNAGFTTGLSTVAYAASVVHTIASTPQGSRTVYARFTDKAGNISTPVSAALVLDTADPVAGSIVIKNGDGFTTSNVLGVVVSATDITPLQMMLSENADFSGGAWQTYQTPVSYAVGLINGVKTVYFKVRDAVGRQSSPALSDTIVLDTLAPSILSAGFPWPATNTLTPAIDVAAEDNLAGALFVQFTGTSLQQVDGVALNVGKFLPLGDGNFTLKFPSAGNYMVNVVFGDEAGNTSYPARANLTIDQTGPSLSATLLVAQGANRRANLSWSSLTGAAFYVVESMKNYAGAVFTPDGAGTVVAGTSTAILNLENGFNYGFRVRGYDTVGNSDAGWSNVLSATVGVTSRTIDQQGELNDIKGVTMDGNTIHLVTANGSGSWEYRRSSDNGLTWTRKILGGTAGSLYDAEIVAAGGRIVIAARQYTDLRMYSSVDGGETFSTYTLGTFNGSNWPAHTMGLAMDGKIVLVAGLGTGNQYSIARSKTGAVSSAGWTATNSISTNVTDYRRTDICMNGPRALHVYLDASRHVRARYSKNGGYTWTSVAVDTLKASTYDNVRCAIDSAGTAYVMYTEKQNVVLSISENLTLFVRRTVPDKTSGGATLSLTAPNLWVSESNRIFIGAHDQTTQTLWVLDSSHTGHDWRMTQVDTSLSAGLHNALTGSGREDYRMVYDIDDKQTLRLIAPALPAPAVFEAKPTYDPAEVVTRWAPPPGVDTFTLTSGWSYATLGSEVLVSGDTLTFTPSYWKHAIASRDAFGTGGISNLYRGWPATPYNGTLSGFYGNNVRDAGMGYGADQLYLAVAYDQYVKWAKVDDGYDALNWQTRYFGYTVNSAQCVDIAADDNYVYIVWGADTQLFFQRSPDGGTTWESSITLVGSNGADLTDDACEIAVHTGWVRIVGLNTVDGVDLLRSNNSGASFSTAIGIGSTGGNGLGGLDIAFDPLDKNNQIVGYMDIDMSNTPVMVATSNNWGGYVTSTGTSGDDDIAVAAYDGVAYVLIGDGGTGGTYFGYAGMAETDWAFGTIEPSSGKIAGMHVDEKGIRAVYNAENFSLRLASCNRHCTLSTGWTLASVYRISSSFNDFPLFGNSYGSFSYGLVNEIDASTMVRLNGDMWHEPPALTTTGGGLVGHYYSGTDLTTYYKSRIDTTLNQNWGTGAPMTGMGISNFSVLWTGWVYLNSSSFYKFCSDSDDGVKVTVNGQLLVDTWATSGASTLTSSAYVTTGSSWYFPISVQYKDNTLTARVNIQYSKWNGAAWDPCIDIPTNSLRY